MDLLYNLIRHNESTDVCTCKYVHPHPHPQTAATHLRDKTREEDSEGLFTVW